MRNAKNTNPAKHRRIMRRDIMTENVRKKLPVKRRMITKYIPFAKK